jgi:hypothetical protein
VLIAVGRRARARGTPAAADSEPKIVAAFPRPAGPRPGLGKGERAVIRVLPALIELGLTVYCLIDCIQTPEFGVRNLPKGLWILLILIIPVVGSIAWLVAGRPTGAPAPAHRTGFPEGDRPRRQAIAPDDDPEFLRELSRVNREHEQTLERWEADLRRREDELRGRRPEPPDQAR